MNPVKGWGQVFKGSSSVSSIGSSVKFELVRLALDKSWWEARDYSHVTGMRYLPVKGTSATLKHRTDFSDPEEKDVMHRLDWRSKDISDPEFKVDSCIR